MGRALVFSAFLARAVPEPQLAQGENSLGTSPRSSKLSTPRIEESRRREFQHRPRILKKAGLSPSGPAAVVKLRLDRHARISAFEEIWGELKEDAQNQTDPAITNAKGVRIMQGYLEKLDSRLSTLEEMPSLAAERELGANEDTGSLLDKLNQKLKRFLGRWQQELPGQMLTEGANPGR